MNWNFFLKPTLEKVLIMIIIFLLIIFAPIIPNEAANAGCPPGKTKCPAILTSYESFYSKLSLFPYNANCLNCPPLWYFIFFVLLYILTSYFLSSLIVSILNKFRKKSDLNARTN